MHSMKITVLMVILSSVIMYTESTLILAGIIAVKAAIVGAFIIGGIAGGIAGSAARNRGRSHGHGRGRYGRSVAEVDEMFLTASQDDADDCAKKLICSLSARDPRTLAQDEAVIVSIFGQGDLDVSKSTVEFDLAAIMGRKAGEAQCEKIYSRCVYPTNTLMEVMRQPDFNKI
jgi:F0F1-type ATP synthase membrane subunit c/vacuolar-type H+-ATPase subunit K